MKGVIPMYINYISSRITQIHYGIFASLEKQGEKRGHFIDTLHCSLEGETYLKWKM